MLQIAKLAALFALAAAAWVFVTRPPVVVERPMPLPQRMVRVTDTEIVYQGNPIAHVPACPDAPCFRIEVLTDILEATAPPVPRGAFDAARLVIVELDGRVDSTTERQVLHTIVAAGYWPIVSV